MYSCIYVKKFNYNDAISGKIPIPQPTNHNSEKFQNHKGNSEMRKDKSYVPKRKKWLKFKTK